MVLSPATAPAIGAVTHDSQSHAGEVYGLFDGLLGRVPDPAGWESFVPALDHGLSPHDLAQTILNSSEWTSRFGDVNFFFYYSYIY